MKHASLLLVAMAVLAGACVKIPPRRHWIETEPPESQAALCPISFRFDGKGQNYRGVSVAAEFNDFKAGELVLSDADGDFVFTGDFVLPEVAPGRYGYKLVVDTGAEQPEWLLDPANPRQKVLGGVVNSMVVVRDCRVPSFVLTEALYDPASEVATIVAKIDPGSTSKSLAWDSLTATLGSGEKLPITVDQDARTVTVRISDRPNTKLGVTLSATGAYGAAEPLYVPLWTRDEAFSFRDSTLYFAFTDRFANGSLANDAPASCLPSDSLANWQGGDWAGMTQKLEQGYFEALGVDALWISAPNDNPSGCYSGSLGRRYSAYHAYFPLSLDAPEEHFGTRAELRALVEAAHARGIRVLIDFVANHLHQESALAATHESWFHPFYRCGWEKPIECWFEPYLPDIDFDNDEANHALVESALGWITRYDLDGFRVDAAKHIGHPFVRNLRAEIGRRVEHLRLDADGALTRLGPEFYTVGETFTGGWSPGDNSQIDQIKEWVSKDELTGQFDFPLWYEVLYAFGKQSRSLNSLKTYLSTNAEVYGDGVMASFLDNHDVPRLISHADNLVNSYTTLDDTSSDTAKQIGWDATLRPGQPGRPEPYRMLETAAAFVMSQKEVPLIYYGDEIGLPGAGDPDNRRMMQFDGALTAEQQQTLARFRKLGTLRKQHPALRAKALELTGLDPIDDARNHDVIAYFKTAGSGEEILVVIDRRRDGGSETLPIWLPPRYTGTPRFVDLESNEELTGTAARLDLPMTRPGYRYLLKVY